MQTARLREIILMDIKNGIIEWYEVLEVFYFRPGKYLALTVGVWLGYLIVSIVMMSLSIFQFYNLFTDRNEFCLVYLLWFFIFFWLRKFSIKLLPDIWEDLNSTLVRKSSFSFFLLSFYIGGLILYAFTVKFIDEGLAGAKLPALLSYLKNPVVLLILGIIGYWMIKVKRNIIAAALWGITGFYHVFSLLPERTDLPSENVKVLVGIAGAGKAFPLLTFLGGITIVLFGIVYLCIIQRD
jgi:hypothetical protein